MGLKSCHVQDFYTEMKHIYDIQAQHSCTISEAVEMAKHEMLIGYNFPGVNVISYSVNNQRLMQSFSFSSWKMFEHITSSNISVT